MRHSSDVDDVPSQHVSEHDECEVTVRLIVLEGEMKHILNEIEALKALLSPGQERAIHAFNEGLKIP